MWKELDARQWARQVAHPGLWRSMGQATSLLRAKCLGSPFSTCSPEVGGRGGGTRHLSAIQFFLHSHPPWSHTGWSQGGPCLNPLQPMALWI